MMMRATSTAWLLAAILAAGCAPTQLKVQDGIDAYQRGEYPAAMQRFVESEGDQAALGRAAQVRYLVFRGLTAWRLGQKPEAKALLAKGKQAYDAGDPRWLPPQAALDMNKALGELGGP